MFQIIMEENFIGQTATLRCRFCRKQLLRKNYKTHIKAIHPGENVDDLKPCGQSNISDLFNRQKQNKAGSSSSVEGFAEPNEQGDTTEELLVIDDENTTTVGLEAVKDAQTIDIVSKETKTNVDDDTETESIIDKKKRHASGDSGFGGDDADSVTDRKRSRKDDENKVTNEKLDSKLDKILHILEEKKEKVNIQTSKPVVQPAEDDLLRKLKSCRSMKEIVEVGFRYDIESGIVSCAVCEGRYGSGEFDYTSEEGLEFGDDEYLPRKFCNLKSHLVCHIQSSKSHTNAMKTQTEKENDDKEFKTKNHKAGMNLGTIIVKNILLGRPYSDYESDVLVLKMSGAPVGELNHSRKFAAGFRGSLVKVVNGRVKHFLRTPLLATGHLPPVALSADKGTFKHRSRQFLSCVSVVPGGTNLLEVLTCGQPVVTQGSSGWQLAVNMKTGFDYVGIDPSQIESGVFDGVYFHCSIEENLSTLYKLKPGKVLYTWDPLHKTGLVDKHITETMKWLQDIISDCQAIFRTFNWGSRYKFFCEATALWRLSLSNLVNFSDTRFANSKRKVFKNIHHQFAPIISCLDDKIKAGEMNRSGLEASDSKVRENADKAKELKGKILNLAFLLTLSGLVDLYEQFGAIVQITQMVHLLPHERLDLYNKAVGRMKHMAFALEDHSNCEKFLPPDSKIKCLWPKNHEVKKSLADKKEIRGLKILGQHPVRAAGLGVTTRKQAEENIVLAGKDPEKTSNERLLKFVKELATDLSTKVYSAEGKSVIEETRIILDLPALALKLKEHGASAVKVSIATYPKFKNAIFKVPVDSIKEVPDEELKSQFKLFLERLQDLTAHKDNLELSSMDPKELIKQFLDPTKDLFKSIEMVLQAVAVCSVKHSCESVLESFVSRYENHFDSRRNTEEDATN